MDDLDGQRPPCKTDESHIYSLLRDSSSLVMYPRGPATRWEGKPDGHCAGNSGPPASARSAVLGTVHVMVRVEEKGGQCLRWPSTQPLQTPLLPAIYSSGWKLTHRHLSKPHSHHAPFGPRGRQREDKCQARRPDVLYSQAEGSAGSC